MKRQFASVLAVLFVLYHAATANAVNFTGAARADNYAQGEILVKFKPGVSSAGIKSVNSSLGAQRKSTIGKTGIERVTISANRTVAEAVADFNSMPEVEFAQPNYRYHALVTIPNDTDFSKQWGLNNTGQTVNGTTGTPDADIDAPEAWDVTTGSSSVVVAVIDSGVDYNHPDLSANIWRHIGETAGNGIDDDGNGFTDDTRGWDFVDGDNNPMDTDGHGTHIAGIIGAVGNNGTGVAGIAWQVQIMPVRVLDAGGGGFTSDIMAGIDYAVNNGANIINISLGGDPGGPQDSAMISALTSAKNAGVTAVIAAGNENNDNDISPVYPASYTLDNIISVAATDQSGNLAWFSNFGATSVDVGAPGVDIYSTAPAREVIFTDDFESGAVGWSMGKTSGDTWLVSLLNPFGGSHSLSDGSEAQPYQANTDSWATSPSFNLAGKSGCTLSAQFDYITEADFDFINVKASKDGNSYSNLTSGQLSGDSLRWTELAFSLKPYEGNSAVSIRFELVTDNFVNEAGVYIDDVSVTCSSTSFNGTEYGFFDGTSFSAPYVSGLAALLLSQNSSFTATELKALILDNGNPASALAGKTVSGKGIRGFSSLAVNNTAPPPISVAGGASSTTSANVTLSLSATDAIGITGYYLSEDPATPSASVFTSVTPTQNFSQDVAFILSSGNGAKTVYVWFIGGAGNISPRASVSINLSAPPTGTASAPAPSGGGGGGGCFIATAAYGSYLERHVMVLRQFRDRHLLTNSPGRLFVKLYYRYSPPIADVIAGSPVLRTVTRLALTPLVYGLLYPFTTLFLLIISAWAFAGFRYRKRPAEG